MNILVTGGCGFIGSNLVQKLAKKGYNVTSVDDMSGCRDDAVDFMNRHSGTVRFVSSCFASDQILDQVRSNSFDVVFHVAAIPRVSYSVENPYLTTDTNISKTVKLMEACIGNVDRFIFSSSSSVYGGADVLPTPNTHPKNPKSPYAWQKSCIEDLIKIFCDSYENFDAVSLRYFNVFGPGQFGGSAYSTAISAWCHAVKNGVPLRKDGTGEQTRDLCYVDNVIDANIMAMNHDGVFRGESFNVACGDRISNNEILEFFVQKFDDLEIKQAPFRSGDVMDTHADVSASNDALGYEPKIRFWQGLERTFEWWDL